MQEIKTKDGNQLFVQIKGGLDEARKHISKTVNTAMVHAYWQVGKHIVEYEQRGSQRAEYGKGIAANLSKRLTAEYGDGFTPTNLKLTRQFYLCFPKGHTLCDQLSWSYCRQLVRISDEKARNYYTMRLSGQAI